MADVVFGGTRSRHPPQRWQEVRAGEWAPEMVVVTAPAPATPDPIATHATVANVDTATWTTIVSRTAATDEDVEAFNCDIAALLNIGVRFRLQVGGVTVWQETVGTHSNSATYPKLRAMAGQTVAVQGYHAEATSQDMVATLVTRPAS